MKFIGIIPARYASTRFPGKPLAQIGDKTMIQRVFERAGQCPLFAKVVVATDDERIFSHVQQFGEAIMTSPFHSSGTERCGEALKILSAQMKIEPHDVVINIQGDEPFVRPEQIALLASLFENSATTIATLARRIMDSDELFNPNVVKVVLDNQYRALYFSRSPIPYLRGKDQKLWVASYPFFSHIGLYGYRVEVLPKLMELSPTALEKAETLEQLRWLGHGFSMHVAETSHRSMGIDTPEDLSHIPPHML